jgi:hypothetical protein
MSVTINKWRVWCTTESAYKYWWIESTLPTPTTCPTNTAHTVNTGLTMLVDKYDPNVVNINQEVTPTGGRYRFDSKAFTATADTTTLFSFSFPINISMLEGSFVSSDENRGDMWSWIVSENTTVGAITASVGIGDTVINVSSTVCTYASIGYEIRLFNGTISENLGRVLSIDTANHRVTMETASTQAFSPATPTYVQMSVVFMRDCEFGSPWVYEYGSSKIKSSYIPANTVIKVYYTNRHATQDKRIVVHMEYLY